MHENGAVGVSYFLTGFEIGLSLVLHRKQTGHLFLNYNLFVESARKWIICSL